MASHRPARGRHSLRPLRAFNAALLLVIAPLLNSCSNFPSDCVALDAGCDLPLLYILGVPVRAAATAGPCLNQGFCYMYLGGAGVNGAYGGITGADASCQASFPGGIGGVATDYRALVMASTRNQSTGWVLYPDMPYRRPDGTVINTTNSSSLLTFPMTQQLIGAFANVWTGVTIASPTSWTVGVNCGEWANSGVTGVSGVANNLTSAFIEGAPQACTGGFSLYCVQR